MVPFDRDGKRIVLEFSDYLSSYGNCVFRIQTKDPLAEQGFLDPYQYHIKVFRDNAVVWAGVIVNNPHRTHSFIEVEARTYAYLFQKVLVKHNEPAALPRTRKFSSGTMASNITTIFNEGKNRGSSPISDFTLSTIENPKYPWQTSTAFSFTSTITASFEAASLLQVISAFADMANADWSVNTNKVFTFQPQLGGTRKDVVLKFGKGGNVDDYDSPLDGGNMTNDLYVASFNQEGLQILEKEVSDTSLYPTYKRLWSSILFNEDIEQNQLNERAKKLLSLNKTPDTQLSLILNEKASPIGTYTLGDYIQVIINDGPINIKKEKRVIGWKVYVNDNGVERSTVYTNNRY